jgi:hypothetical protein
VAQRQQVESESEKKKIEQRALRDAIKPIALTVETIGVEAFKELHDAIGGSDSSMTLQHVDPLMIVGAEEEGEKPPLESPLVWYESSKITRRYGFMRIRPGTPVWDVAKSQLRPLASRKKDAPRIALLWGVCSEGSQSPAQIVWGGVAVELVRTTPTVELRLLGIRRADKVAALDTEELVKDHLLECLGEALHV